MENAKGMNHEATAAGFHAARRPARILLAGMASACLMAALPAEAEFDHRKNGKAVAAESRTKPDAPGKPSHLSGGSRGAATGGKVATPASPAAGGDTHAQEPARHTAAAEESGLDAMTADDAFSALIEGNKRYLSEKNSGARRGAKRRGAVAAGQKPFAIVVGCADSRVPPEIVFDQGLGDLFVMRTAGNLVDPIVLGSMEYAVEHLGVKLIVVLGHERCGAVGAAVQGGEAQGNLKDVLDAIKPAVDRVKAGESDLLPRAVRSNVKMVADKIRSDSKLIAQLLDEEEVRVVGCTYDLDDGVVTLTYMP